MNKIYLGDGVYAEFDGYQIWLETQGEYAVMRIALEPAVFDNLCQYAEKINREKRNAQP